MGRVVQPHRHQFLDIPLANGHYARNAPSLVPPPSLQLTSREESTRVQLQKQRLREQDHAIIVSQKIPGLQTSAAFFASLRTNLRLIDSPPPSPISTPTSMRASTGTLPPPSPLSTELGTDIMDVPAQEDPLAGVPELKSYVTTDEDEKVAALKLVADSVAQMRQTANSSLMYNPLNLAVLVAILSLTIRFMIERNYEPLIVATTCSGAIMTGMALCRYLTQGYIAAAEAINMNWLGNADVMITKFGDEVIGTVIIDWISGEGRRERRKKIVRGEVKALAVRLKYRGKGVGSTLLDDAVKESRSKGAETLEFADEHANSKRVLPKFYNGKLDKPERQYRELLQDLLEASPTRTRKRRNGSG